MRPSITQSKSPPRTGLVPVRQQVRPSDHSQKRQIVRKSPSDPRRPLPGFRSSPTSAPVNIAGMIGVEGVWRVTEGVRAGENRLRRGWVRALGRECMLGFFETRVPRRVRVGVEGCTWSAWAGLGVHLANTDGIRACDCAILSSTIKLGRGGPLKEGRRKRGRYGYGTHA